MGEGDEWWRYVPSKLARVCLTVNLDCGKLMQEFPHRPSVKDVPDTADLFNGAAVKLNISSLPNFAVRYPHSGEISTTLPLKSSNSKLRTMPAFTSDAPLTEKVSRGGGPMDNAVRPERPVGR